ncbi:hypothetical protein SVAN01_05255 [Stagonosporopsis vannaccii]|nr:hypothetical protein SVAN01_05255 [Stagonosporopsis vannaccii]
MGNNERPFYRTGINQVDTVRIANSCEAAARLAAHALFDSGKPILYIVATVPTLILLLRENERTARPSGACFRTQGYAPGPVQRVGVEHVKSKRGLRSRGPCMPHMSQAGVRACEELDARGQQNGRLSDERVFWGKRAARSSNPARWRKLHCGARSRFIVAWRR